MIKLFYFIDMKIKILGEYMRRVLWFILSLLMLIGYLLVTDPYANNNLLTDIPYGIQLVFVVKTFLLLFVLISMLNLFTDPSLDKTYGYDELDICKKAMQSAEGAGYLMISRSLRYISIAIIILGVLYFTK